MCVCVCPGLRLLPESCGSLVLAVSLNPGMKEVPCEYKPHPGSVPLSGRPLACMLGRLGPWLFWALLVEGGD